MNVFIKIVLSILTIFSLFVLVYFTFIAPNYLNTINSYTLLSTGTYTIWENNILTPEVQSGSIKVEKLENANNIYYKQWSINLDDTIIELTPWIYFIEFNEVQTKYSIKNSEFEITNDGPASFIINTRDEKVFTLLSISGKVNITPKHPRISKDKEVNIEVYPNMYFISNRNRAISFNNVDLNRVQQLAQYNSISWDIYFHPILIDDTWKPKLWKNGEMQFDTSKYSFSKEVKLKIFNNDDDYDYFIKNIYDYKDQHLEKQNEIFDNISKKQFYNFPGEDYISNYYDYFLNNEKKKYYYKNLILKKLIIISNSEAQKSDIEFINEKLIELKDISNDEYLDMIDVIQYYYENILYTQKDNTNIIISIDNLYKKVHNTPSEFLFHSLVNLNYVYENKVLWVPEYFNKNISVFMELYRKELWLSNKQKLQEKYSYYIYFIKNLLLNESSNIQDYNNFVKIFQEYVNIFSQYITNANTKEIETQIFNSSQLIDVFLQIMREVLFVKQRNDRNLLEQQSNSKIDFEQYVILKNNLNKLTNFYLDNKNIINSKTKPGSKEEILLKKYSKVINVLEEYFLAMDNYPEYELKYDKAIWEFQFNWEDDTSLSIQKAKNYLYQFQWAVTETADIKIRNYSYCKSPEKYSDDSELELSELIDPYCYEIKKIEIDWIIFSFILSPFEQNEISYLTYTNKKGEVIETTSSHVMDKIKENYQIEFDKSQSKEKDKYNFSKFFTNNYWERTQIVDNDVKEENIDTLPPIVNETIWVEILKRWLISDNAPLKSIQNILPISYRYLLVDRVNNEYIVNIFPTDFSVDNPDARNANSRNFIWKLSGIYIYNTSNHYFTDVKIQPIENDDNKWRTFIFNDTTIEMIWDIYFTQLETHLVYLSNKLQMLEYFYKEIIKIYWESTQIKISFDIQSKMIILEYENKKVEISDNGQANIFQNGRKISGPVRYSTIDL